jgi:hypothetical protein
MIEIVVGMFGLAVITGLIFASTCRQRSAAEALRRPVLQLCSHPVIGWPDASPGPFGLRSVQVAQFEPEVILLAVGWYLRFSSSGTALYPWRVPGFLVA